MLHAPTAFVAAATVLIAFQAQGTSLTQDPGVPHPALQLAQLDSGSETSEPSSDAPGERSSDAEADPEMAAADQSGMETPDAFRFAGSMASLWTRQMVEAINQDIHVTLPLMIHPREYFDEGTYVWDAWPICVDTLPCVSHRSGQDRRGRRAIANAPELPCRWEVDVRVFAVACPRIAASLRLIFRKTQSVSPT